MLASMDDIEPDAAAASIFRTPHVTDCTNEGLSMLANAQEVQAGCPFDDRWGDIGSHYHMQDSWKTTVVDMAAGAKRLNRNDSELRYT